VTVKPSIGIKPATGKRVPPVTINYLDFTNLVVITPKVCGVENA
jgi:hypothetical protein